MEEPPHDRPHPTTVPEPKSEFSGWLESTFKPNQLYFNRELSWLEFNRRVLEEALDASLPLLERVKFLAIFSSNLDEFYMIRVAGLLAQVEAGVAESSTDGALPAHQLRAIRKTVMPQLKQQRQCWHEVIRPALAEHGIVFRKVDSLTAEQQSICKAYFESEIFPTLTPLAVDVGRPFPHISNLSKNFAIILQRAGDAKASLQFARLKIPDTLPRFLDVRTLRETVRARVEQKATANESKKFSKLPKRNDSVVDVSGMTEYVMIEDIIQTHLSMLFPGMTVKQSHIFRVIRDADVEISEDEASDLLETIEQGIRQRRFGHVVRMSITKEMPRRVEEVLRRQLGITKDEVYVVEEVVGFSDMMKLAFIDRPELKFPNFVPRQPSSLAQSSIFAAIRAGDILMHHPYDSFKPTVDFFRAAAQDPDVVAIKTTLYRVGANSPITQQLLEATMEDKQVAALVELKARFDEENNIIWARALEDQGVHVVYGLVGLKTHSKVGLVIRREPGGLRRYVHLSTGNYNATTARFYTDLALFTCDDELATDVTTLFNRLTGFGPKSKYSKLMVAPEGVRPGIVRLVDQEIVHVRAGREGHIIWKCNSLTDAPIICKLYEASQAGVKVELIIRGICCLIPQLKDISENITCRSIIGRYLEHSRVYWFANDGDPEVLVGSADMMGRNLNRRIETVFPIRDVRIKKQLLESVLRVQLKDNVRARILQSDGSWLRCSPGEGEKPFDCQEWAMAHWRFTSSAEEEDEDDMERSDSLGELSFLNDR